VTCWHFCKTVVSSFFVTKNAKRYVLKLCKFGSCLGPTVLALFSLCLPMVNSMLLIIITKESKKSSSSEEQEWRGPAGMIPKEKCAWAEFPIVLAPFQWNPVRPLLYHSFKLLWMWVIYPWNQTMFFEYEFPASRYIENSSLL